MANSIVQQREKQTHTHSIFLSRIAEQSRAETTKLIFEHNQLDQKV